MVEIEVVRIDIVRGDEIRNREENDEKMRPEPGKAVGLVKVTTYPDGSAIGEWMGYVNDVR